MRPSEWPRASVGHDWMVSLQSYTRKKLTSDESVNAAATAFQDSFRGTTDESPGLNRLGRLLLQVQPSRC